MKRAGLFMLSAVLLAHAVAADELRLKDGTVITGNIVGFENGAFKVETSYGFALVKKEKVESIKITETKAESKPAPAKKEAAESKPPAQTPPPAATPSPPPASAQAAPKPPAEVPIREELQGSYYVNHTYGFRMFKPPSWQVIEGARRALPTAVVAMGTGDETTLLIVGREPLTHSLEAHAAATEKQLRDIYENYRPQGEQRASVAGFAAVERRFRGLANGREWSATTLSFARGNDLYTILGMTYADSDLIQIQENVIHRTISSLQFTR
jgi:hypothetical protein